MLKIPNYEENYSKLPFEDVLRQYRNRRIVEVLTTWSCRRILEVGSGPKPISLEYADFDSMTVVEPGDNYFMAAQQAVAADPRVGVIHGLFEDVVAELSGYHFDAVLVGGFLHEIDDPSQWLKCLRPICAPHTIVHTIVPNANSFHRLLAIEMGLIESVFEPSANDILFQRRNIFNRESFTHLFVASGFEVLSCETQFVKPLAHSQMRDLLDRGGVSPLVMEGLNRMTKYMPDLGAEIFLTARLRGT